MLEKPRQKLSRRGDPEREASQKDLPFGRP
jgi:hypothetical protein